MLIILILIIFLCASLIALFSNIGMKTQSPIIKGLISFFWFCYFTLAAFISLLILIEIAKFAKDML